MVLTKGTSEIAAVTANREDVAARMKAPQRFLFNGVEGNGSDLPVIVTAYLTILIAAGFAKSRLTLFQPAQVRTEAALYLAQW